MKGGKLTTFDKVLIGLAIADLIDISAKGNMLWWLTSEHPEAAEDWNATGCNKFINIRKKMIIKVSDILAEAFG